MSAEFRDHFTRQSAAYRQFRPGYPSELFRYLASISPSNNQAWDCATGNGQAAIALTDYFDHVIATDASAAQIAATSPHPQIDYQVARAEQTTIPSGTLDLVTVAQALHWFDLSAFQTEVRRVLKPGGRLAVWTYNLFSVNDCVDRCIRHFYHDTLGDYWPGDRSHVEDAYRRLHLTLAEISAPAFVMQAHWSLSQLLGYLSSWSAYQAYINSGMPDPLAELQQALGNCWAGPEETLTVTWPLTLRLFQP